MLITQLPTYTYQNMCLPEHFWAFMRFKPTKSTTRNVTWKVYWSKLESNGYNSSTLSNAYTTLQYSVDIYYFPAMDDHILPGCCFEFPVSKVVVVVVVKPYYNYVLRYNTGITYTTAHTDPGREELLQLSKNQQPLAKHLGYLFKSWRWQEAGKNKYILQYIKPFTYVDVHLIVAVQCRLLVAVKSI